MIFTVEVIGGHFGGGDHFDGGDHFGGGTDPRLLVPSLTQPLRYHSNQLSRFPPDFLHTFTVILPLITGTML